MEDWNNIPWQMVLTTTELVVGGLFALILLTIKFPAARYLGRLLLSYLLILVSILITELASLRWGAFVLVAISIYLYSVTFFSQKTRVSYWHMLPLIISISLLWVDQMIASLFSGITILAYTYFIIKNARSEGEQRGINWFINPGSRISWFRNFLCLNVLSIVYLYFYGMENLMVSQGIILVITSYALYQVVKESTFLTPIPIGNKYQKSTLNPAIKASILSKLDRVVGEEKFYLRDDASLTTLAAELGATTHHLSQVLNESKQISFQDLLSQYRIREACRLLKDPKQQQVKIENVAAMVGYNSKSAFNTAFKKRTSMTPSEYRTKKDVLTYGEERLTERTALQNKGKGGSLNHVFNLKITHDMMQHFFKIFFRNLKRNKVFSLINLFGLTVGFTCSILIYLFIADEHSYDKDIPDYDRIHRVSWMSGNPQTRTPHPMAQAMVNDWPEVETAVSLSPWYGPGLSRELVRVKNVKTNVLFEEPDFFFADSTFLDVFELEVIEGDKDALRKPWTLVITEEMAKKYFGDSSAIGKELSLSDWPLAVSAVVRGMPEKSHFHFNGIIPYMTLKTINPDDDWMTWNDFGHFNYIKLKPGVDAGDLEGRIPDWVEGYLGWPEEDLDNLRDGSDRFVLQPIASIHLGSRLRWELENNGNILFLYILTATLFFLLFIAAVNYVNLTTAKSMERAKEIGVRKTLGAVSVNLSVQFYLESMLFCLGALILALTASYFLLDSFNFLSGKEFIALDILNTNFLVKAFSLSLLIGLAAGFYPATMLSSFKPTEVLKGKLTTSTKGVRVRGMLVVAQFVVSAVLIAGSLIILRQVDYMKEKELGFDQDALVSIRIPASVELGGIDINKTRSLQTQIESVLGVRKTTTVSNLPGGQFNQHPIYAKVDPANRIDMAEMMVSFNAAEVFDFEIVKGRSFEKSYSSDTSGTNFIINESAVSQLNLEEPIGEKLIWINNDELIEGTIVGVVKDFHYRSLHEEIQPLLIQLSEYDATQLVVKMDGTNFQSTLSEIEAIYQRSNDEFPFEYHFLDQQLAELYQSEVKTLSIFSVFSVIALILACLGLLGVAIAMLNQRVKEVGMRKILGASSTQIAQLILGQFIKLVGTALLIGLPIAFIVMQGWMREFSYQAPFGLMPFVWSALILLFVAVISVSSAVLKIAFSNPIDSLKCE